MLVVQRAFIFNSGLLHILLWWFLAGLYVRPFFGLNLTSIWRINRIIHLPSAAGRSTL